MITFGGRPLNTYTKTYKGGSQIESENRTDTDPILVEVQPESVNIFPPESEITNNPLLGETSSKSPTFHIGGTVLNQKELVKLDKQISKARFNNLLVVKIFGAPIVITFWIIWWILTHLSTLGFILGIGIICYYLYEITQALLDAGHKLLDGVSSALTNMNNASIKFEIPNIFKFDQKLFGNAFAPWIRDVDKSNNSFPRTADVLAVDTIKKMMIGLADSLPGMIEGVLNVLGRAFVS